MQFVNNYVSIADVRRPVVLLLSHMQVKQIKNSLITEAMVVDLLSFLFFFCLLCFSNFMAQFQQS